MENNTKKVLIILDLTFKNERTEEDFLNLKDLIESSLTPEGYEVNFKVQSTFLSPYDCDLDAEYILKLTDEESALVCIEDYSAVIVEGTVAWFWLQSMYSMPILCVNPVIDIYEEYEHLISDELKYVLDYILLIRGFYSETAMCVISNENHDDIQYYDNVFTDNTVILSDYSLNSKEFWSDTDSLLKALNYIVEKFK